MSDKPRESLENLKDTYEGLLPVANQPIFVGSDELLLDKTERLMRRLNYFGRLIVFKRKTVGKLRQLRTEQARLLYEVRMVNSYIDSELEYLRSIQMNSKEKEEVATTEVNPSSPVELPPTQEDMDFPIDLSGMDSDSEDSSLDDLSEVAKNAYKNVRIGFK